MSRYFFFHPQTGQSWDVPDPVAWLVENAPCPLLERARERLLTLGPTDCDRIVRLVTRRCGLVLIDLACPKSVVVHHWGQPLPDIRQFLKKRQLARPDVQVALANRKTENVVIVPGSEFIYGDPSNPTFPWLVFERKWTHRYVQGADDWDVAPHTCGTLCWEQASSERMIPWAALKSAWRHDQAASCQNCGTPLMILRFLWVLPIMFSGIRKVTRGCFRCHCEFENWVDMDFWGWLVKVLDAEVLPTHHYATKKFDLRSRYPYQAASEQ